MKVSVEEGFDERNQWWYFVVDPIHLKYRDEAERLTHEIAEWCEERFGEPSIDDMMKWYVSDHRAFTIPNVEQAFEFKMRWVGEH